MCLINPTTTVPMLATADIECIKLLGSTPYCPFPFAPVRLVPINNELYEADYLGELYPDTVNHGLWDVDHGIHTYHLDAIDDVIQTALETDDYVIRPGNGCGVNIYAKCIIPRATYYYANNTQYCSERIKILAYRDIQRYCEQKYQDLLNLRML